MNLEQIMLVQTSFVLVMPIAETAATLFYQRLFELDPSLRPMFRGDMQEQGRKEKEKVEMRRREGREEILDPRVREEMERKEQIEMEMREVRQAALVRLAKINMDQAIQIANSQQPGKVLECNLEATHWKEPGKLADDGYVFYHVMIANENSEGAVHIWVNAVDGSIIKTEKELPRKRQP